MRFPLTHRRMLTAGAAMVAALGAFAVAGAVDPGLPGIPFMAYGQVQVSGANISPEVQKVVAFVNGVECGTAMTKVATAGDGTPAEEVGRTVYVVDVLADGGPDYGSKAGCGRPGDLVTFYFPEIHRVATQHPAWQSGARRENLDLGVALSNRLVVVGVSAKVPN